MCFFFHGKLINGPPRGCRGCAAVCGFKAWDVLGSWGLEGLWISWDWCHAGHRDLICLEDFEPKRIVVTDDQPPEKTRLVGNPTGQCQVTCQFYGQDMDMGHGSTEGTMMSHCMLLTASFDASLQQVAASVGMMVNWIMGIIPIAVSDFVFGMCYVVM